MATPVASNAWLLRPPRNWTQSQTKRLAVTAVIPAAVSIGHAASSVVCQARTSSMNERRDRFDWKALHADIRRWADDVRPFQWYPGHVAKAEKDFKAQLKLMDLVIEVRDGRIPLASAHPSLDSWIDEKRKKKILVLNREDLITLADRSAWARYLSTREQSVLFCNGKFGQGSSKIIREAKKLAGDVNVKRRSRGLISRPVRAGVVGYPNVGKSSLINRLLKRRKCPAAPRPGVTRAVSWVRFGTDLELLDSPGLLPVQISDQSAALKLAICDDIGDKAYDIVGVASVLVQILYRLPSVGADGLYRRYRTTGDERYGIVLIERIAQSMFKGDKEQAALRVLMDFRRGNFGQLSLERPPTQVD